MFQFNKEQSLIKNSIKEFVGKRIESEANERALNKVYPNKIISELVDLGFSSLGIPEKHEGSDLDTVSSMIILNELAKSDASLAYLTASNFLAMDPISKFGTEEQIKNYLIPTVEGEKVGVFAFNEPDGCGPGRTSTVATQDGDYFVINGTKSMITNASNGDYALVFAKTTENPVMLDGYSLFFVDLKDNENVTIGKDEETMGLESARVAEIYLDNVRVHKSNMLGALDKGFFTFLGTMNTMRLATSSIALGLAERAYEEALEFSKTRVVGDSLTLNQTQSAQFKLADMKAQLELTKLATFYNAHLMDQQDENTAMYAAITKNHATEAAKKICDDALQMFGGYGYARGNTIERLYRDVRALSILFGPVDTIKTMISRFL